MAETEIPTEKTEKAKRGRRAGQIVSRGDNKWLIRVYLGADPATGKRDYYNKTFHGTKKEADKWLSKALTRHAHGEPLEESAQSFGTWLDEWLKIKSRSIKPRTKEIYGDIVERILKPDLGKRALVKIARRTSRSFTPVSKRRACQDEPSSSFTQYSRTSSGRRRVKERARKPDARG